MSEVVTILFPSDPGSERLRELQGDLRALEGFAGAGTEQTRSAGIAELAMWVGFAADALGLVSAATETLGKIAEKVRGQGIRGAVIELPNGVRISIDSASPDDIKKLVSAWQVEKVQWSRRGPGGE